MLDLSSFNQREKTMDDFNASIEPPRQPYAMKVVGTGVIVSCLLLSVLFAWGIYLDLQKQDCPQVMTDEFEVSMVADQ